MVYRVLRYQHTKREERIRREESETELDTQNDGVRERERKRMKEVYIN